MKQRKGESTDEYKKRAAAYQKEWRARNVEHNRNLQRKSSYKAKFGDGAYEHYEVKLAEQGHVCAICGSAESIEWKGRKRGLCLDHCHKTDALRGVLCSRCNLIIGMVDDDPDYLAKCAEYLGVYR